MVSAFLAFAFAFSAQLGPAPDVLPNTPQGQRVAAYITAFNAGEDAFVSVYEVEMIQEMAAATPPARRKELYMRLVSELGRIRVERVLASSPKAITFSMRVPANNSTATFSFKFEEKAPYRISAIDLEISQR